MKKTLLFLVIFLAVLVFSANAADIIVLKDGNMIEAKVMEIHPTEIRYKRADNLNGPMMFLPADRVLSIRYENGVVEVISASPVTGQGSGKTGGAVSPSVGQQGGQTAGAGSSGGQQAAAQTPPQTALQTTLQASLQNTLNALPAIRIAGKNLKFQFSDENWTATVNGENFSTGSIELEETNDGTILNLKQTHIWPGAVAGKAVGKLASKVPGGAVAGSALNAAGGLAGAVEASGPVIVLEYKAGPPAKLSYLRSTTQTASGGSPDAEYIVLADAGWRAETFGSNESLKNSAVAQFNIANEQIDGWEGEVLTLETKLAAAVNGQWKRGEFSLENQNMVQQLREGSGVRFKVLGDGGKWTLQIPTIEGIRDRCWFQAPVATKRGKVVEINIPYSKLKPYVDGKRVPFVKESITTLTLFIYGYNTSPGSFTMKVFDFEIY